MRCCVCGGKGEFKFVLPPALYKCEDCYAEYLEDLEKDREDIYSNDYWMDFSDKEIKKVAEHNFSLVLEKILNYRKNGSLLDVGGGNLIFASLASKYFDVSVVDLNPLSSNNRVKTIKSDFLSFNTKEKYDVITAFSFIEHIPYPHKLFSKFSAMLNKRGMLFVITPDVESLASKILGRNWYQYKYEHVLLYSKKSLSLLSSKYNLKMISFKPHFPYLTPYYLIKYAEKYRVINPSIDSLMKSFFSFFSPLDVKLFNPFAGEAFVAFERI